MKSITQPNMKTATRLLALWWVHAYMDLMWMTRDLKNCLIYCLSDIILSLAAVTGTLLLAERFEGIASWTKFQVTFMLGYATIVMGCRDMLFGYNVGTISRRLGRGQLDHTLIQPQPLWMALLTEGFTPFSGTGTLLSGIGLMMWAISQLPLSLSIDWFAMTGLNLMASLIIFLSFSFSWGSLAFWAPRAAEEISSSANRLMQQLKPFPLDGLGGVLIGGMLTIFPVGFFAWYPCRYLLGLGSWAWGIWLTPLAAVILASFTAFFFFKGLKHYGQTGSQRYLGFGHRS